MTYPESNNSRIVIPKDITDRDIADAHGFDVVSADSTTFTMIRNRPNHIKLAGHAEFLGSLPPSRVAQAWAAVRVLRGS